MKIAIVSLKFSPGHMAHIRAYRELFSVITENVELFLAPEYQNYMGKSPDVHYTEDIQNIIMSKPDLVFIYNISTSNIPLASACKKNGIRSVYVLHEPRCSFKELLAEGRTLVKMVGANIANLIICKRVDKVLLASETGKKNYERYMKGCNRNYDVFPLIFLDEFDADKHFEREYFSFIGGFTGVHACNEFLQFMEYALPETRDMKFLIATKTDVSGLLRKEIFQRAIEAGRLTVQSGGPMTTEEINAHYRRSICVWNAYNRSTQSGVLPNALMQGTPVIVNENGAAKETLPDKTAGCYIKSPLDYRDILNCCDYISSHIDEMSQYARKLFKSNYLYSSFIELARSVIFEK